MTAFGFKETSHAPSRDVGFPLQSRRTYACVIEPECAPPPWPLAPLVAVGHSFANHMAVDRRMSEPRITRADAAE